MKIPNNKKIILFDGDCNLCNKSIQMVIKYDKKDIFRFVSQQSIFGQKIMNYIGLSNLSLRTIVLYETSNSYFIKSSAFFKVINYFPWYWKWLKIFNILPSKLTDSIYDFISNNRHHIFNNKKYCMLPKI